MAITLIDPRIRRRRIEVRRNEGRRRLRLLLIALVGLGVAAAGWWATRSSLLDVDHIRVLGSPHTPASVVTQASRLVKGMPMTEVDESAAADRVVGLPWVDRATVERGWPGTVTISVTERKAAAAVRASRGTWMAIDADGLLLGRVRTLPEGVVVLKGVPFPDRPGSRLSDAGAGALAVATAIPPERARQVPVVARLADGSIELPLMPGGVARLGSAVEVDEKLLAVFTVLDQVDLRGLAVLDVRVPSAPVVVRHGTV